MIEPKELRLAGWFSFAVDLALQSMAHAKCPHHRSRRGKVDVAKFEGDLEGFASFAGSSGSLQGSKPEGMTAPTSAGHLATAKGGIEMMAAVRPAAVGSAPAKRTVVEKVAAGGDDEWLRGVASSGHAFRLGRVRVGV